jgi:hypothetical protein
VSEEDKKEDLERLRFENGDIIPDVGKFFFFVDRECCFLVESYFA